MKLRDIVLRIEFQYVAEWLNGMSKVKAAVEAACPDMASITSSCRPLECVGEVVISPFSLFLR